MFAHQRLVWNSADQWWDACWKMKGWRRHSVHMSRRGRNGQYFLSRAASGDTRGGRGRSNETVWSQSTFRSRKHHILLIHAASFSQPGCLLSCFIKETRTPSRTRGSSSLYAVDNLHWGIFRKRENLQGLGATGLCIYGMKSIPHSIPTWTEILPRISQIYQTSAGH